jgi:hypothetical protein
VFSQCKNTGSAGDDDAALIAGKTGFEDFRKRCYLGYDPAPNTAPEYSEAIRTKINRQ